MVVRRMILRLAIICFCTAVAWPTAAQIETRVALIIGNSAYRHTPALLNPRNDAEALGKFLKESGFAVTLESDLDYRSMRDAVRAFGAAAREAGVALVYFAGHGLEVGGQNYLVPVDARLARESDLEYEAVTLASVLSATAGARRLGVVILDACRNNPLSDKMQLAGGATRSVARGLARIEPSRGVLVAYAAKEGTVAQDGTGRHSPYAEALLRHLATPGLDVRRMFDKVRDVVLAATHGNQEPFISYSLPGDDVPLMPGLPPANDQTAKPQSMELAFWASVKDSKSPTVLRTYLDRYPNGQFATIARALIEDIEKRREEERKRAEAAEQERLRVLKEAEDPRKAAEDARRAADDARTAAEAAKREAEAGSVRHHETQSCESLWVERNSYYKQANYCFTTQRAIAYFGNAGCSVFDQARIRFPPGVRARILEIRRLERAMGCPI